VKTVSTHRTRILKKTGLRTNAEIVQYVISHELR
jgi:DNA-binding CsgD family transcriptional regulator